MILVAVDGALGISVLATSTRSVAGRRPLPIAECIGSVFGG
jgi:hypothetical protein